MIIKNTKIICTLGPASDSKKEITELALSGMNAARLNFSHGTYSHHKKIIKNVRSVSKKLKIPITIIQDLQGPKIRIGEMPKEGIVLLDKEKVSLTTEKIKGDNKRIPIQYNDLPKEVKKGDTILLCDGIIELKVTRVQKNAGRIFCTVISGGIVKSHKGINVPTASIKAPAITEKDKKDLKFGLKNDVDYIALSFVKNAKDIHKLRKIIQQNKKQTKIISKIERHEAIDNLEEIIEASDAVMVARGDLGAEIAPEKVPLIQKRIIKLANIHAIPVITATEILQSMGFNPRATRAEISDAANAILDHTDCLMLSNETAVGKFPTKAAHTLSKTALEVENHLSEQEEIIKNKIKNQNLPIINSLCLNACRIARDIKARQLIVITNKGYTARQIAKHRPYIPIITITSSEKTQKELGLVWGLNKTYVLKTHKINVENIKKLLIKEKLIKKKDELVFCNAAENESFIKTILV